MYPVTVIFRLIAVDYPVIKGDILGIIVKSLVKNGYGSIIIMVVYITVGKKQHSFLVITETVQMLCRLDRFLVIASVIFGFCLIKLIRIRKIP